MPDYGFVKVDPQHIPFFYSRAQFVFLKKRHLIFYFIKSPVFKIEIE